MSEADSARIISEANVYFTQCKVTLQQAGSVQDAAAMPSVINSQADLNQACGAMMTSRAKAGPLSIPRRYRIVNAINWCGGPSSGGTILGCTPTPGTCVVQRRWSSLEGQVLAHEFGHSKGLPHRNDTDAVMYPSIGATHTKFNAGECAALRQLAFSANGRATPRVSHLSGLSIEEFVSQTYPDGMPLDIASQFTVADVARVAPWLHDPAKAALWSNVASVVGAVGGNQAYETLHELVVRKAAGKLTAQEYDGRVAAIMSMGLVVRRSGSRPARQFLESHTDPASWASVEWTAPYQTTAAERNTDLAAVAALGLSRAGDAEAITALNARLSTLRPMTGREAKALQSALVQAITDAKQLAAKR